MALTVEAQGHTSKAVLACCIPYHHINILTIGRLIMGRVVLNSNGCDIIFFETLILKHLKNGGLANRAITQGDYLHLL